MHASGLTNRPPSLPAEQGRPWLRREGRGPPMDIQRGARGAQGTPQMAQASPRSRRGGGGREGGAAGQTPGPRASPVNCLRGAPFLVARL